MNTIEEKIAKRIGEIKEAWTSVVKLSGFVSAFLQQKKVNQHTSNHHVSGSGKINISSYYPDMWGNKFELEEISINGSDIAGILKQDKELAERFFYQYSTMLKERHFKIQARLERDKSEAVKQILNMN